MTQATMISAAWSDSARLHGCMSYPAGTTLPPIYVEGGKLPVMPPEPGARMWSTRPPERLILDSQALGRPLRRSPARL
jgi:hypothetical protein